MNENETSPLAATSLKEMQQVARNQMVARIEELNERAHEIKVALNKVDSVHDMSAYLKVIERMADEDAVEFEALALIGEHYEFMKDGNYFQ